MGYKCNFHAKAVSGSAIGMAIGFFYKKLSYDKKIKIGRIPPVFAEEESENK